MRNSVGGLRCFGVLIIHKINLFVDEVDDIFQTFT